MNDIVFYEIEEGIETVVNGKKFQFTRSWFRDGKVDTEKAKKRLLALLGCRNVTCEHFENHSLRKELI